MNLKALISAHKNKPAFQFGLVGVVLGVGLLLSMTLTNPQQLGPFGITVWFAVLFLVITSFLSLVIYGWRRFRGSYLAWRRVLRHSMLVAFWLTALLALNSLRQLNGLDVALLTVFVGLFEFYAKKR